MNGLDLDTPGTGSDDSDDDSDDDDLVDVGAAEVFDIVAGLGALRSPFAIEDFSLPEGVGAFVVDDDTWQIGGDETVAATLRALPCVTIAVVRTAEVGPEALALLAGFDVVLSTAADPVDGWVVPGADNIDGMLGDVLYAIEQSPKASLAMVQLLRSRAYEDVPAGLFAESVTYGLLQAGSEFRRWLDAWGEVERADRDEPVAPVLVDYEGLVCTIALNRPQVRNAYNAAMRDGLVDALRAASTGAAALIVVRGNGPSFCSGGDLDEFGTATDPSDAHVIRSTRSAPWWMWRCADWLRVEVQGAAVGAGAELSAYAARVSATEDAFFMLPEVGMGLVPGAGGTVSIPRRIGPHRAAYMALSGARLDARTALRWRLVDEIVPA